MKRSRFFGFVAGLATMMPVACAPRQPQGQVLATVDGEDVTLRDLDAEARAAGVLSSPEAGTAERNVLLNRTIDRKLLLRAAASRGLDRAPEYLAAVRRAREMAMVDALRADLAARLPAPDQATIDRYIATHSWAFARRQILYARRFRGGAPLNPSDAPRLVLDTALMVPAEAALLATSALGAPVVRSGATIVVEQRISMPILGPAAYAYARDQIAAAQVARAVRQIIDKQRGSVAIRFRQGLGPAAELR